MKQKVIILLLAFFSIGNLAVPGTAVKAYAEENTVIVEEINFTPEELQIIENGLTTDFVTQINNELENNEVPPSFSTYSVQTKAVKAALKAVVKNKNKLVNAVGKVAGRDEAVKVGAALNTVMPVFNKLLKYQKLAYSTVQDQVASALISAGIKSSSARSLAYWIRQGLEWVV